MTYARARLWLGVTTVGMLVVVATFLLMTQGHAKFIRSGSESNFSELKLIAICVAAFATVMIPFDLLGGFVLPTLFGRTTSGLTRLTFRWLKAVLIQSTFLTASLWIVLQAGQAIGIAGAIAAVVVIQLGLVASQKWLAMLTGGLLLESNVDAVDASGLRIATVHHTDSGFTGSIVGLPGAEEVVIPQSWQSRMKPEELDTQLVRRSGAVHTGSRFRGLVLALLVNTATFGVCVVLPNAGVTTVLQLFTATLYFTVASFVWLLLLPRISREGVFEADRFAFDNGHSVKQIETTANQIESMHDDEPRRSRQIESVFHPVPCVRRRVAELTLRIRSIRGCWNAARMTLFLSWACGGFLSRAVHCNIGRPELWVLLPTD